MSTTTTLLSLTKPDGGDPALISVLNANFDVLDATVTLTGGQTLTNKTLTGPHMTTPVVDSGGLTITAGGLTVTAGATSIGGTFGVVGAPASISGALSIGLANAVLGGGATALMGSVGGSGPANTTQQAWLKMIYSGTTIWVPYWT